MKVIKYFSIVSFLISNYLSAQVGINIENPLPATSLHIDGSDAGVLINKVSLDDINDDTLGTETLDMTYEGLMVYNTNTSNTGNPESDVLPGFYFWNGSSWRIIGQSTKKRSGWVSLIDGDYSINLPFVNSPDLTDFSNFTNIELDFENDASDAIIESFAPTGYSASDLFDSSGNRITPITLGDTILLRLQFDADPNNGNGVIVIQLDIGANDIAGDGDDIVIFQKSIPLVRGSGRVTNVSESILLFQLGTFLTNGAKLRMAYTRANQTTGSSCDVSNFSYVIQRLD
ncbi:MAG: hypothetical protein AAF688_08440 [Bacteroidota bacterium]